MKGCVILSLKVFAKLLTISEQAEQGRQYNPHHTAYCYDVIPHCPLLPDPEPFCFEFRQQTFHHSENVFDFDDVVLATEEWSKSLQVKFRADAELRFRLGHTASDDEAPRTHFEKGFGFVPRFFLIQWHRMRQRFLARTERGLQDANAARIAIELAADRGFRCFISQC